MLASNHSTRFNEIFFSFRYYFAAIGAAFKLLSLSLLVMAYYSYTPPVHRATSQMTQDTVVINDYVATVNGNKEMPVV